jgi:hypothetical protein
MEWFFDVTAVGPIWTPVLRAGVLAMVIHQLALLLLTIRHREHLSSWWTA